MEYVQEEEKREGRRCCFVHSTQLLLTNRSIIMSVLSPWIMISWINSRDNSWPLCAGTGISAGSVYDPNGMVRAANMARALYPTWISKENFFGCLSRNTTTMEC